MSCLVLGQVLRAAVSDKGNKEGIVLRESWCDHKAAEPRVTLALKCHISFCSFTSQPWDWRFRRRPWYGIPSFSKVTLGAATKLSEAPLVHLGYITIIPTSQGCLWDSVGDCTFKLVCKWYYVNGFVSGNFSERLVLSSSGSRKKKKKKSRTVTFGDPSILKTWSLTQMGSQCKCSRCDGRRRTIWQLLQRNLLLGQQRSCRCWCQSISRMQGAGPSLCADSRGSPYRPGVGAER